MSFHVYVPSYIVAFVCIVVGLAPLAWLEYQDARIQEDAQAEVEADNAAIPEFFLWEMESTPGQDPDRVYGDWRDDMAALPLPANDPPAKAVER